jgi:hypothetical protein
MLQNEFMCTKLDNISPNINNIEFQEDDAIRMSTNEKAKFIYRARKIVDTGKIYLPLETDEWMSSPSA